MFPSQNYDNMTEKELLIKLMSEVDEVKRYSAATYGNVDKEINEIRDTVKTILKEVKDNDRQLDRMERHEKVLDTIERSCRNIERRIK